MGGSSDIVVHTQRRGRVGKGQNTVITPITGRCMPGSGVDPELVLFR